MILDAALLFDTAAAVTGSTTVAATNVIPLTDARDMGIGDNAGATPKIMVLVTTAFLTTDSATLQVQVMGSTDNSTYTIYAESDVIAASALTAGARLLDIDMPRPKPGAALPKYLTLNYAIATGHFTTGAVTSAIVLTRGDNVYYPPGVTVSN